MSQIQFISDPEVRLRLRPLTDYRQVEDLVYGLWSIKTHWERALANTPGPWEIPAHLLPNVALCQALQKLPNACRLDLKNGYHISKGPFPCQRSEIYQAEVEYLHHPEDLLTLLQRDLSQHILSEPKGKSWEALGKGNQFLGDPSLVLADEQAIAHGAYFDLSKGPIYLGAGVEIEMGAYLQGPIAIMRGTRVLSGAQIRGATYLGSHGVMGGEIKSSLIFSHSNKGHQGYLGDSIIGSFCNLGAMTTVSNLKNNWKNPKVYDYSRKGNRISERQKLGLISGDYVSTAIASIFNTGTVIGSHANLVCHQFPDTHIPPFRYGQAPALQVFQKEQALAHAKAWRTAKGMDWNDALGESFEAIWKGHLDFRN